MLAIVFFSILFVFRGWRCGKGERARWREKQCFYSFYTVLASHWSSCPTEIERECWSAYLAGSKMCGARLISHCDIHRMFPQGWVKGSSATSAEQMQAGANSLLLGRDGRHYSEDSEVHLWKYSTHCGNRIFLLEKTGQCYLECFLILGVFYIHACTYILFHSMLVHLPT